MSRHLIALFCALSLIAIACTSDESSSASSSSTTTEATTTAPPTTTAEDPSTTESQPEYPVSGLDGSLGEAADLVLAWLSGEPVDRTTFDAAFDDAFRDQVPFDEFTSITDQLVAPYSVVEIRGAGVTQAQVVITSDEAPSDFVVSVVIAAEDDPTMTGLFFAPDVPFDSPADTDEAIARLEAQGTLRLGIFDGDCASPIIDVAAGDQAPLGSAFKLWVLAAVVEAVDTGTISWDDTVTVRDELDSIPSGVTQDDPAGTELTVRVLAERMIEISDNTATDHLIDLVGREAVEQVFVDSGHSDPSRNRPMMTTREFTIVKFGDEDLRRRYLEAGEAERRQILDDEVSTLDLPPVTDIIAVVDPIEVESLEWFGSPADLCRILTQLSLDAEAFAVLTRNPVIPDEESRWASIAFKGGSEPGVLAMAWLMQRDDGSTRVVAGSISNEDELLDEGESFGLFGYLRDDID